MTAAIVEGTTDATAASNSRDTDVPDNDCASRLGLFYVSFLQADSDSDSQVRR